MERLTLEVWRTLFLEEEGLKDVVWARKEDGEGTVGQLKREGEIDANEKDTRQRGRRRGERDEQIVSAPAQMSS